MGAFPADVGPGARSTPRWRGKQVYGLIWTTTPWTLPANLAIAFHPKYEYVGAWRRAATVYIVAADLLEATAEKCGWGEHGVIAPFPGHELGRARCSGIRFIERDSLGILGDHVTLEQGTGAVHTAPGHGRKTTWSGMQYGIAGLLPGGCRGTFLRGGRRGGRDSRRADRQDGLGSQPDGDRDSEGTRRAAGDREDRRIPIRTAGAATTRRSSAPPSSGSSGWTATDFAAARAGCHQGREVDAGVGRRAHLQHDLRRGPDWCISRQRVWGVPIVVFYCDGCREPLTDRKILDGVVRSVREHRADIWFERSAAELVPAGHRVREVRRQRNSAKRTTFWTSGSIPARATWRC